MTTTITMTQEHSTLIFKSINLYSCNMRSVRMLIYHSKHWFILIYFYYLHISVKEKVKRKKKTSQTPAAQLSGGITQVGFNNYSEQNSIMIHPLKPVSCTPYYSSGNFPGVVSSGMNLLRSSQKHVRMTGQSSSPHWRRHGMPCRLFARTNCNIS